MQGRCALCVRGRCRSALSVRMPEAGATKQRAGLRRHTRRSRWIPRSARSVAEGSEPQADVWGAQRSCEASPLGGYSRTKKKQEQLRVFFRFPFGHVSNIAPFRWSVTPLVTSTEWKLVTLGEGPPFSEPPWSKGLRRAACRGACRSIGHCSQPETMTGLRQLLRAHTRMPTYTQRDTLSCSAACT